MVSLFPGVGNNYALKNDKLSPTLNPNMGYRGIPLTPAPLSNTFGTWMTLIVARQPPAYFPVSLLYTSSPTILSMPSSKTESFYIVYI